MLTFHSLRHSAVSLLRKKGLPYDYRCYMVGHEPEGQHSMYGEAIPASVLAEEVLPVFEYPNLDLSKLKYQPCSHSVKKWSNERGEVIRKRYEAKFSTEEQS